MAPHLEIWNIFAALLRIYMLLQKNNNIQRVWRKSSLSLIDRDKINIFIENLSINSLRFNDFLRFIVEN